jgi:hypothetical protein
MKEMKKESALIAPTACAHSTKQQAQKMQGRTASTEDAGPYSQHRRCRAAQPAEDSRDSRESQQQKIQEIQESQECPSTIKYVRARCPAKKKIFGEKIPG